MNRSPQSGSAPDGPAQNGAAQNRSAPNGAAPAGQPMTRREARRAREAAEAAQTPAAEVSPLRELDFDAVITGPIPQQQERQEEEREPVAVAARHGSEEVHAPQRGEPSVHELFGGLAEEPPRTGQAPAESPLVWRQQNYLSHEKPRRRRRGLKPLVVTLVVLLVLGGLGGGAYAIFQPQIAKVVDALTPKEDDYKGDGTGEVLFTIKSGDTGSDVATNLAKSGVTKTYSAFYTLLLRQRPEVEFQPGVFKLAKRMSAQAALLALQDPASRMENTAVIPEGTAEKDALATVAAATKLPLAELQAAAAKPADYGVPAQAKTLEGFLFPATYTFAPGVTAHDAIKTMVDRMFQALDEAGVPAADRWKTVVLASVVQREAGLKDDYPKVARVFLNRLAQGWKLQSDATVAYGTGNTHRVETTDAERADASNPYNTYVHPGLPVGPISNPGDLAINAVMHPASGSWMFFVTWNLKTGETIFSTTEAEHEAAVQKWQQWMKDNPGYE